VPLVHAGGADYPRAETCGIAGTISYSAGVL